MEMAFGSFSSVSSSSDRALCSPDLSSFTASPQMAFLYEQEDGPGGAKGGGGGIFEFPPPLEFGELDSSFWSEGAGSGGLLETSFADSCKASLWDFSSFDDISSPLQRPEDDLTPTLNELNNDDSQSFDAMLSSHSAFAGSAALKKQWRATNTTTTTAAAAASASAAHGKTPSSMAGPMSADVGTDTPERVPSDQEPLLSLEPPSVKSHSPPLSSKFVPRTGRDNNLKSSDRLSVKTSGLQHHRHHHPAKPGRKTASHHRLDPGISDVSIFQKRDHSELKWSEMQSHNHEDEVDREIGGTTVVSWSKTLPEGKRLTFKDEFGTSRARSSGGVDGYDSHDEGLGSEHEDQDEEDDIMEGQEGAGLSDVEEEEDDDACSDTSEDHGLASASTKEDLFPPKVKSRRSEYDDLTPNPKRLLLIGNELHKLNKVIGGMIPVSALPPSARNRSRKEKNKLASRACRLKKKAQHEANKVKLYGLEKEHDRLMQVITAIRRELLIYLDQRPRESPCLSGKLNTLIKSILGQMVADHTQEFVSGVLEKTANGSKLTGGLSFLTSHD